MRSAFCPTRTTRAYEYVFSGYIHIAGIRDVDGVVHANPGTLLDRYKNGMSERPTPAIYETRTHTARPVPVE